MGLHPYRGVSRREQCAQIVGSQPVGARQEQFRGDDILANQSDVIPWRHRLENLHRFIIELPHVFNHDDCVGPSRERVARVHISEGTRPRILQGPGKFLSEKLSGAKRILGADADAVHSGGMVMGR